MGRTAKLDFSIDRVRAIDGEWIAVRYSQTKKDGGNRMLATGVTTGVMWQTCSGRRFLPRIGFAGPAGAPGRPRGTIPGILYTNRRTPFYRLSGP